MKQIFSDNQRVNRIGPTDVPLTDLPTVELTDEHFQKFARRPWFTGPQLCDGFCSDVLGELALAEYYGLTLDPTRSGHGSLTLDGLSIEVTTVATPADYPPLLVPIDPARHEDIHVLAQLVDPNTVRLVGYLQSERIRSHGLRFERHDDLHLIVPPHELTVLPDP